MPVLAKTFSAVLLALPLSLAAFSDPLPPDLTYRPLPTLPLSRVKAADEAQKAAVMQRQSGLLNERYDLSDRAMQNVMMSGGRKPVQQGVRVKLAPGTTWDAMAEMSPDEIRQNGPITFARSSVIIPPSSIRSRSGRIARILSSVSMHSITRGRSSDKPSIPAR